LDLNESDFEIAKDFFTLMRKAREQRNLSQEELGLKINEKSSVIRTLESGKLKPTDTLAKKIERFLKIKILITPEK
jgi:putative transcription factor